MSMPPWVTSAIDVVQLVVNVGALLGGAIIWKLYVDKLKATLAVKDAEISSVEKNRDMWKDKAQELEKHSPEFMERILGDRIQIREGEIARLTEDKDRNAESLKILLREKGNLESDLARTRGFRLMLAIEEEGIEPDEVTDDTNSVIPYMPQASEIEVVLLGEVGVDSGQLMITDPCYIDQEWDQNVADNDETVGEESSHQAVAGQISVPEKALPPYSYEGVMSATLSAGYGELAFTMGHAGAGVVFATAWGDGVYPVYGELHDGRIIRVYITAG